MQRHGGSQPEAQPPPIEAGTVRADVELVGGAGVVESRTALQMKRHLAADHTDPPDQFIRHSTSAADRHVILYLAHAIFVQETGNENGGVRPVELPGSEVVGGWGNPKPPALSVVQHRGKDAR